MSYSGDKVWAWTTENIIIRALRIIGEYDEGDLPPANELTSARHALNGMLRQWTVTDGVGLWLRSRCLLILNPGKWRYRLGPVGTTGTDDDFHCFLDTELAESTGTPVTSTTINVDDDEWVGYDGNPVTKAQVSDHLGIVLDDGTMLWDTISAINVNTVTLTTGSATLTADTAGGNRIYTYTTRLPRPHGILTINRESTSKSSASIDLIGRKDYELLSLKASSGPVTKAHFDPGLDPTTPANNYATLHTWPVSPDQSWMKVAFVGEFYPDEALVGDTDSLQFPDEWASTVAWNLANELADEYEIDLRRIARINSVAEKKYANLAWAADRENASFFMARETYGRR